MDHNHDRVSGNCPSDRYHDPGSVSRSHDLPDRTACRHVAGLIEWACIKAGFVRYTQIGFVGILTAIEIAQNPPTLNPKITMLELSLWREVNINVESIPRFQ